MKLLREYIKEMLREQNVLAVGMCFPFAAKKAEEWFDQHFEARRGRAPKRHPDLNDMNKFKVVHGKVTDQWKKPSKPIVHAWVEMGDLVFDDQTKMTKPNGIPKDVYYDMYQPEVVKEYNAEEVVVNCIMKGEGPWDEGLVDTMNQRDAWMKESQLRNYIGKLLTESIDPKIMRMINRAEKYGLYVDITSNSVLIYDGHDTDKPRAKIHFERDTSFGPCSGGAYVTYAKAEDGFGPLAYEVAVEATGGLMSDRTEVSPDAAAVWDYYANNRPDVKVDQLDILDDYLEPQLTPDDKSDDCDQVPAYDTLKSDWHTSSLSKKISKKGTPVIDELRSRGMLYDDREDHTL